MCVCVCVYVCLHEHQKKKIQFLYEAPKNYFSFSLLMSHSNFSAGMQSLRQTVSFFIQFY